MSTKEEAKQMYEGKHFYEVIDSDYQDKPCKVLLGPFNNIYYVAPQAPGYENFKFVQVIDGLVVAAFTESEILVTDRIL